MTTPLPQSPFLEVNAAASVPIVRAIVIVYVSCDGAKHRRKFKTVAGARTFAHYWVGPHPEVGSHYAIAGDGVGKIVVKGATLREIFP